MSEKSLWFMKNSKPSKPAENSAENPAESLTKSPTEIASVVMIAIKEDDKILLFKDEKSGFWKLPSEEFDDALNGDLDNTVKRTLKNFLGKSITAKAPYEILGDINKIYEKIEYLGSFLKKKNDKILIGYSFLVENPDFESGTRDAIKHVDAEWFRKEEIEKGRIENTKVDKNTLIFIKINKNSL